MVITVYFIGTLATESMSVQAKYCYAISPEVCEKDGSVGYCFDKQLLLDIGVQVQINIQASNAVVVDPSKGKCKICKKLIK